MYGSSGSPSNEIFEQCVAPLVDALFQGYNATVLAYGQVSWFLCEIELTLIGGMEFLRMFCLERIDGVGEDVHNGDELPGRR